MPAGNRSCLGNELFEQLVYLPAVTYPTLAANASGSNTTTIAGVLPGDLVSFNMQSPPAHLVVDNVYISAANTVTILWSSDSTGISTGTVALLLGIARWENSSLGVTAIPSNLA
jgi:hypothetical protein